LFGLATIWLVLTLRRRLGSVGTLAAAALLAVSPGAVYLSRYFIHESLFVFFTLGIIVAALKYYEDSHPVYLILAAASAALLFATKETWIISVGVLIIALCATHIWRWCAAQFSAGRRNRKSTDWTLSDWFNETIERLGGTAVVGMWFLVALLVFVGVGVLFYSSFTTNWKGVSDSLSTFAVWSKTGQTAHKHDHITYIKWLLAEESSLLALGAAGAVVAVLKPKNSFALFAAFWAFGILAAYSLVPYKTPWLTLNFIVPLAIVSGYLFQAIYDHGGMGLLRPIAIIGVVAICIAGCQTITLNFLHYDDDSYVYVYAHSRREMLNLVEDIDKIAQRTNGGDTGITIVSRDYWPLPWYFRDYKRVGYFGAMSPSTEPVIIASENQRAEAEARFGTQYRLIDSGLNPDGSFALRPGVDLLLFVRRDVRAP
jgi:uncharacterized protein (TIGR03663 family)